MAAIRECRGRITPGARAIGRDRAKQHAIVIDRNRRIGSRSARERGRRIIGRATIGDWAGHWADVISQAGDGWRERCDRVDDDRIGARRWTDIPRCVRGRNREAVIAIQKPGWRITPASAAIGRDRREQHAIVIDRYGRVWLGGPRYGRGRIIGYAATGDRARKERDVIRDTGDRRRSRRICIDQNGVSSRRRTCISDCVGHRCCQAMTALGQRCGGERPIASPVRRRGAQQGRPIEDRNDRARRYTRTVDRRCRVIGAAAIGDRANIGRNIIRHTANHRCRGRCRIDCDGIDRRCGNIAGSIRHCCGEIVISIRHS